MEKARPLDAFLTVFGQLPPGTVVDESMPLTLDGKIDPAKPRNLRARLDGWTLAASFVPRDGLADGPTLAPDGRITVTATLDGPLSDEEESLLSPRLEAISERLVQGSWSLSADGVLAWSEGQSYWELTGGEMPGFLVATARRAVGEMLPRVAGLRAFLDLGREPEADGGQDPVTLRDLLDDGQERAAETEEPEGPAITLDELLGG